MLDETTSARLCLEEAERRTGFRARWKAQEAAEAAGSEDGMPMRGIGLAVYFHGAGFTGYGERKMKSPVTVALLADGRLEVLTAMTDMGQGCAAVFPQIAAAAGRPRRGRRDVRRAGHRRRPRLRPHGRLAHDDDRGRAGRAHRDRAARPGAGARIGTEARRPGRLDRGRDRCVEPFGDAARQSETAGPVEVTFHHEPPEWQTFDERPIAATPIPLRLGRRRGRGRGRPGYPGGPPVARCDRRLRRRQADPPDAVAEGQIEGGTLQALGWALLEAVKLQDGRYSTPA